MTVNFRACQILQLNWEEFDINCKNEPGTIDERPQDRQVLYCAHNDPARSEGIPPAHEAEIRGGIPAAEQVPFASQIYKFKSSICRFIQEVFNGTFGDDPAVLRFSTPIL